MKKNMVLILMAGVIFFSLFFVGTGNTKGKEDRWVLYGTSDGDYYYDKKSMTRVSPNIIRVWNKVKHSKVGKNDMIIDFRKSDLPFDDYDKLDNMVYLEEFNCRDKTYKFIKIVEYNDQGTIIEDSDNPNQNILQILPGSMNELLLRTVCSK